MAINIFSGPNSVIAKNFADGIDPDFLPNVNINTIAVIYEIDGRYRSWVPGRDLNQFNTLRAGIGYLIIAKQGLDLTNYFNPPISTLPGFDFVVSDGADGVLGDGLGNVYGGNN